MKPAARITLPGTALAVSRLCLGGNRLGSTLDRDASCRLLDAFAEAGGNFLDTAHVYADWIPHIERSVSEKTIGHWLRTRGGGSDIVVATKGGHPPLNDPTVSRLDPASIRADVAASLECLGRDRLDLFYLHRDDSRRDVESILGVLEELRLEGLVRHYAASNWKTERLEAAEAAAKRQGWQGFVANQPEWSFAQRNPGGPADLVALDAGMAAFHRRSRIACIPYSAQAKGYFDKLLTGNLSSEVAGLYHNSENRVMGAALHGIAGRHEATATQIMLKLLVDAPFPTVPVIGCQTSAQIDASFMCLGMDVDLSPEEKHLMTSRSVL